MTKTRYSSSYILSETGTVLTINTSDKKLLSEDGGDELVDVASSFTPQKMEFIRAGGSYAIVFGKMLQTFACETLGIPLKSAFAPSKEVSVEGQGLTAVEKIFNANAVGVAPGTTLHAGSDVRVRVNIVGSQDTTGLMTAQELEAMAATVISPTVDGAYQSGCHTASVWDFKAAENTPKLMKFMHDFGLITGRDPKDQYHPMTDVIHKVLNDITVDDWAIIIGGDSHTRMSKGVAFGADSGTVALALATGEATMPVPESVKVTFTGSMADHMDFRDVVHATQSQMLKQFGDNVFQGRVIEVHIGTLLADQAFTFTDWTAEMKAKASICISEDATLIESLEIAKHRIQIMIDKGMENDDLMLHRLIGIAEKRIAQIRSGEKPALAPDANARYAAEVVIDLDLIPDLVLRGGEEGRSRLCRVLHGAQGRCENCRADAPQHRKVEGKRRFQRAARGRRADLQHHRRAEGRGRLGHPAEIFRVRVRRFQAEDRGADRV